jgi:hypothetical protein
MTPPQTLVQAALARLAARLGSSAVDAAANLALFAQDAPEKVRQELQLFWEEVQQEADRLERGADRQAAPEAPGTASSTAGAPIDLQDQIDGLRAQVARLSRGLERRP